MPISRVRPSVPLGVVLDMDGVVINTSRLHEAAWRKVAERRRFRWNTQLNFSRDVFGTASPDSARLLFPGYISASLMPHICHEKARAYEKLLRREILNIVVPGFSSFFRNIIDAGIPVALATSSPKSEADFVLKSLGVFECFSAIIDVSQVRNPKPHPEAYLIAARAIGFVPERCVGFEDSLVGIEAVNRANMKCVVVGTTLTHEKLSQRNLKYDLYVSDFRALSLGELSLWFSLRRD